MKKLTNILILIIFLIIVHLKDGTVLNFDWAGNYTTRAEWNKITYYIFKSVNHITVQSVEIPAENVLYIEKK